MKNYLFKSTLKYVTVLGLAVFAFGCSHEELPVLPEFEDIILAIGEEKTIEFNAYADWEFSFAEKWIDMKPAQGRAGDQVVKVSVGSLDASEFDDTAVITYKSDEKTVTFNLTRKALPALKVTAPDNEHLLESVVLDKKPYTKSVKVAANFEWTISRIPEWLEKIEAVPALDEASRMYCATFDIKAMADKIKDEKAEGNIVFQDVNNPDVKMELPVQVVKEVEGVLTCKYGNNFSVAASGNIINQEGYETEESSVQITTTLTGEYKKLFGSVQYDIVGKVENIAGLHPNAAIASLSPDGVLQFVKPIPQPTGNLRNSKIFVAYVPNDVYSKLGVPPVPDMIAAPMAFKLMTVAQDQKVGDKTVKKLVPKAEYKQYFITVEAEFSEE